MGQLMHNCVDLSITKKMKVEAAVVFPAGIVEHMCPICLRQTAAPRKLMHYIAEFSSDNWAQADDPLGA